MRELIRDCFHQPYIGGWLAIMFLVLLIVLASCSAPVNAPDPITVKQQFRADMAGFCLRNPAATGCEKFSKGVQR